MQRSENGNTKLSDVELTDQNDKYGKNVSTNRNFTVVRVVMLLRFSLMNPKFN